MDTPRPSRGESQAGAPQRPGPDLAERVGYARAQADGAADRLAAIEARRDELERQIAVVEHHTDALERELAKKLDRWRTIDGQAARVDQQVAAFHATTQSFTYRLVAFVLRGLNRGWRLLARLTGR
jgi:ABC-type phosphate transport system auxiliary subunit